MYRRIQLHEFDTALTSIRSEDVTASMHRPPHFHPGAWPENEIPGTGNDVYEDDGNIGGGYMDVAESSSFSS